MKILTIIFTIFLLSPLYLFADKEPTSKKATSLAEIIQECDRIRLKQHKMSDVLFATKLKQINEYYNTSIKKNWKSKDPIIDTLHHSFKEGLTTAQRAAYDVFMIKMFNHISTWATTTHEGKYCYLPISQWSSIQRRDAVTDNINKLFADQDELRQLDATPYISIFNSETLNKFDNLYQLLLTAAYDYGGYSSQTKHSLFEKLTKETKNNTSLQINTFVKHYNGYVTDSIHLLKVEELIARSLDDNSLVKLIDMRLNYMFDKPNHKDQLLTLNFTTYRVYRDNLANSSYYEQLLNDCNDAIKRFDDSKYLNNIKKLRLNILTKKGEITNPRQVYPNTPFKMKVVQQNYDNLEVTIYRVEGSTYSDIYSILPQNISLRGGYKTISPESRAKIEKLLPSKSDIVFKEIIKFKPKLYVEQKKEVDVSVKDIGNYIMICRNQNGEIISTGEFCASRIAPLYGDRNGAFYIYATDFMSGKPIERIEVDIYNGLNNTSDSTYAFTKKINIDGFVKILDKSDIKDGSCLARVIEGNDHYTPLIGKRVDSPASIDTLEVSIFTDRKRYMLGDTICFRGYLYNPGKRTLPNYKLTYYIQNPSYTNVANLAKEVTTDDWGGFDGKFVITSNMMAGRYKIHTNHGGYTTINVGDYKPPTIEIEMTSERSDYSLGDSVKLNGTVNAYAGYPMANAKISYTITRSSNYYFSDYSDNIDNIDDEDIIVSETTSNQSGEFHISFCLEPQQGEEDEDYIYAINASVTTQTGETQVYDNQLFVGVNSYNLRVNATYNDVNRDTGSRIVISALDVYQNEQDGIDGTYKVLSEDREILSGQFTTGTPINVPWNKLENGDYEFAFKVDKAEEVYRNMFLYSASEESVPVDTLLFYNVTNSNFSATKPLKFVLGSSEKVIYTLVELYDNNKKWYSKVYVTKNRMEQHTIPYNKDFPNDLKMMSTTFYKGKLHINSDNVKRHVEKKQITFKLKSIRKIASPGSQESLSFEVKDKETGRGVKADILVSIYDKSSDKPIENIYKPLNNRSRAWIREMYCSSLSTSGSFMDFITYAKQYDKRIGFEEYEDSSVFASQKSHSSSLEGMLQGTGSGRDGAGIDERTKSISSTSPIKVRDNFNQTALFTGGIRTDSMGVATINYKLPDAIAAYSIKAFATLKNTTSAVTSSEFIVTKSVMIVPNLPQFFRVGDKVDVRANAVNITDKKIDAKVTMEIFDVSSKRIIESWNKLITIKPNSSEVVMWSIPAIKIDKEIIGMRFILDSPNHTDAEERIMPIVPDKERLVEGCSYFLNSDKQQIKVNLKEILVDSASSEILYVTSGSPSLMLLNTISHFDVDSEPTSVIGYANRLHIYGLGYRLADKYRHIIESMAKRELQKSKDEEQYEDILDISRSETPWNKKVKYTNIEFLQSLLDREKFFAGTYSCLDAIKESINSDGGLGWFKGMPSSFTVSAYFIDRYIALSEAKTFSREASGGMYTKVATYLDDYIAACYNESISKSDKPELNSTVAYYLYIRSGLPLIKLGEEAQKVRDYYLKLIADGEWKELSIMDKAYIAMALKKMKLDNTHILKDLSEYAVKNETLGYYFPNAVLPIRGSIYCEVSAHSLLLRLYTRNETYDYLANGLMQWLMLQRKNQAWSANAATLDATWAISDYCQSLPRPSEWGGMRVMSNAKLGTQMPLGSLINVSKVKNDPKAEILTVVKSGSGTLFVDIMYSYKLPLKQITQADNGFNITRRLYRFNNGKYDEVNSETVFNIGDRVLAKYFIQNSENRSYVRVKALRSGALEPVNNISGYENGYYREVRKSHNNYFFYLMPEGSTTIDEYFTVWYSGKFNDGFVGVQSLYEPTSNGNTTTYTMGINNM